MTTAQTLADHCRRTGTFERIAMQARRVAENAETRHIPALRDYLVTHGHTAALDLDENALREAFTFNAAETALEAASAAVPMGGQDFAHLALLALDQAGASTGVQRQIQQILQAAGLL